MAAVFTKTNPLFSIHKVDCSFTGAITVLTIDLIEKTNDTILGSHTFTTAEKTAEKATFYVLDAPADQTRTYIAAQTGAGTTVCIVSSK